MSSAIAISHFTLQPLTVIGIQEISLICYRPHIGKISIAPFVNLNGHVLLRVLSYLMVFSVTATCPG